MQGKLRRAKPQDAEAMTAVKEAAILGLLARGYSSELIRAWAKNLNPHWLGKALGSKASAGFLLGADGLAIGSSLYQGGRVKALYVRPEHWRHGAGRILLRTCEEEALSRGQQALRLFAALHSRGFYERLGYLALARGQQNLPQGLSLPGWEMEKRLC